MKQKLIIGVGGAGCYLANQLRSKISGNSLAIDRVPYLLNDYAFSKRIEISEQNYNGHVLKESYKASLLQDIKEQLKQSSVLVLAIGLGGYIGTSLGVAIAKLASSMGINIVCAVYKPFAFEVPRHRVALDALEELQGCASNLVIHDHAECLPISDQSESLLRYFNGAADLMINKVSHGLISK